MRWTVLVLLGALALPLWSQEGDGRVGLLAQGRTRALASSEDSWVLIGGDAPAVLDVTAVAKAAEELRGQAVRVFGAGDPLVVTHIEGLPEGLRRSFSGRLLEPEIGFDSGAAGYRLVDDEGRELALDRFDEVPALRERLAELAGQRLWVEVRLAVGSEFYEDAGSFVAVSHVVTDWAHGEGPVVGFITRQPDSPPGEVRLVFLPLEWESPDIDLAGVVDAARPLEALAVEVWHEDGRATHLRALPGGLRRTFVGTVCEPQVGFDDGALGYHLVGENGAVLELSDFGERHDLADALPELVGVQLWVETELCPGVRFYEARGFELAIDHRVMAWKTDASEVGFITREIGRVTEDREEAWVFLQPGGSPDRVDVSLVADQLDALAGKAVRVYRGAQVVTRIEEIPGGLRESFVGVLLEPAIGFDDGAPGYRLDDEGTEFDLDGFSAVPDLREKLDSLVGKRLWVEVRLAVGSRFYESGGDRLAIDREVIAWEIVE